jgi:hypothetical protein
MSHETLLIHSPPVAAHLLLLLWAHSVAIAIGPGSTTRALHTVHMDLSEPMTSIFQNTPLVDPNVGRRMVFAAVLVGAHMAAKGYVSKGILNPCHTLVIAGIMLAR